MSECKETAPVIFLGNYTTEEHYKRIDKWFFSRDDLHRDFKGTVKPKVKEYFLNLYEPIIRKYPSQYKHFYLLHNRDLSEILYENSEMAFLFISSEEVEKTLRESTEEVELASINSLPIETVIDDIADSLAELVFEETKADRHDGGFALIAECTDFEPYGGLDLRGDS